MHPLPARCPVVASRYCLGLPYLARAAMGTLNGRAQPPWLEARELKFPRESHSGTHFLIRSPKSDKLYLGVVFCLQCDCDLKQHQS